MNCSSQYGDLKWMEYITKETGRNIGRNNNLNYQVGWTYTLQIPNPLV